MDRRFVFTLLTFFAIIAVASVAVFLAKGYRFSAKTGEITGTGILSVTSVPDQASIYLDGHLTSATNTNINSLTPKTYDVRIEKEGYITWQKKVEVRQGLVTEIKAVLFRSLPSVYPLTYTGVENVAVSPDGQKIAYVVPSQDKADPMVSKKSGIWVWQMGQQPVSFARGTEPHQVVASNGLDFSRALLRWSPDSSQILATLPDRQLLADASRLNDPPKDITAILDATTRSWAADQKKMDLSRLQTIKDTGLRQTASESAVLKWSPDASKLLYCQTDCEAKPGQKQSNFKVVDLATNKTYSMPPANSYTWTPDSEHLVLAGLLPTPQPSAKDSQSLVLSKLSVVESDGSNKAEIYAGNFDPQTVIVWPDGSRVVVVSSYPTASASQPNLYGINLK